LFCFFLVGVFWESPNKKRFIPYARTLIEQAGLRVMPYTGAKEAACNEASACMSTST